MSQAVAHIPISPASASNQGKLCLTDNRSVVKDSTRQIKELRISEFTVADDTAVLILEKWHSCWCYITFMQQFNKKDINIE